MSAKKILIVEDDSMLHDALVDQFTEEGFLVHGSRGGEDACEYLKIEKPDIVITDLIMSGVDGFEVLRIIKESSLLKEVPVIVISNSSSKENIDKAMELGAKDFLVKAECSLSEIVKKVKKVVK